LSVLFTLAGPRSPKGWKTRFIPVDLPVGGVACRDEKY